MMDDQTTIRELKELVRAFSRERDWEHHAQSGRVEYTFPAYSFTVLRFE